MTNSGQSQQDQKQRARKMLMTLTIIGIVTFGCIGIRSLVSVIVFIVSSTGEGTVGAGGFWSSGFPIALQVVIAGICVFAVYRLTRTLRK